MRRSRWPTVFESLGLLVARCPPGSHYVGNQIVSLQAPHQGEGKLTTCSSLKGTVRCPMREGGSR